MKTRVCFWMAILLAVVTLTLHAVARDHRVAGSRLRAQSWTRAPAEQRRMLVEADVRMGFAKAYGYTGLAFMIASLGFVVSALLRHERGWYSIPIMLLLADVVLQMLL